MMHLVREIKETAPFYVTLRFNTGEVLKVDLESSLRKWSGSPESKFRKLLEPDYFIRVKFHPEMETIYWDNGIDLCPDVFYAFGKQPQE